jgi:hypothetical protein
VAVAAGERVSAGSDVRVSITLQLPASGGGGRGGGGGGGGGAVGSKAHTPYYAKGKDWGWWLAIGGPPAHGAEGDDDGGGGGAPELYALKRVAAVPASGAPVTHELVIGAPAAPGLAALTVYVVSDAMAGLDASAPLRLSVV